MGIFTHIGGIILFFLVQIWQSGEWELNFPGLFTGDEGPLSLWKLRSSEGPSRRSLYTVPCAEVPFEDDDYLKSNQTSVECLSPGSVIVLGFGQRNHM